MIDNKMGDSGMEDNRIQDNRMEDKEDYLSTLNERQLDAVTTTEGYVRIIAGAGTGKTKALTHRYAYLVNELGISTSNILCVTFTNKAAREMSKRIRQMIGDSDTGYICTFHGFCVKLLREDIHAINFPQNFVVMDDEDTEEILKTVYENAHIQSRTYTFDSARDHITALKSQMLHIPYLAEIGNEKLLADYEKAEKVEDKVFLGYLYEQKKVYGLDYDDLITIALYILQTDETKRIKWQERMMYVMVDEFQDVSNSQYALAEILSGYHRNLFIVGDPDQTIYTWRGAQIEYILEFDETHENTRTIFLDMNYRSTPEILAVSNSLIEKNKKRLPHRLEAYKESGRRPIYIHSRTTGDEAQWMTSEIQRLVSEGASYNEMAVLYRSHFVSRNIEESFIKAKIPYTLYSGVEFYKRKEIKDVLAYLRMIVYSDDLSFRRVINEPNSILAVIENDNFKLKDMKDKLKFINDKLLSNSYKSGFASVKDKLGVTHPYEDLQVQKLKDTMDVQEVKRKLEELLHFLKQPICEETFVMKSALYNYINRFWDGKCFLLRANAAKNMREVFETDFAVPLREYIKKSHDKEKDICIDCGNLISGKEKVSIAFMKDMADDLSRKRSAFWNCKVDAFLCPICAYIYALAPLGFLIIGRRYVFVNVGSDIDNLLAANNKYSGM